MWGLIAIVAAAAQPVPVPVPAAEATAPPVPQSFLDCAARFREELRQSYLARFTCTYEYLEFLPGSSGTTLEMNETRTAALAVADRYLEEVLVPELEEVLKTETDSRGNDELTRVHMLENVIGAGRLYASSTCNLVYEGWGPGSFQSVAAANCHVRQIDDLIENLFRLRDEADPVG